MSSISVSSVQVTEGNFLEGFTAVFGAGGNSLLGREVVQEC